MSNNLYDNSKETLLSTLPFGLLTVCNIDKLSIGHQLLCVDEFSSVCASTSVLYGKGTQKCAQVLIYAVYVSVC